MQTSRSLLKVITALDAKIDRVVIAGDSLCSIMAIRRHGVDYKVYFQNRVAEIAQNLKSVADRVGFLEPVAKIAGVQNPADVATRPGVKARDVMAGSLWLKGPAFLTKPREDWPLSVPADDLGVIPETEIRKSSPRAGVLAAVVPTEGQKFGAWLETLLRSYSSLSRLLGVLARVLRARMSNPPSSEALRTHPTPRDIGAAFHLLLHYAQAEVRERWRKGELQGLQAWMPTGSGTFA